MKTERTREKKRNESRKAKTGKRKNQESSNDKQAAEKITKKQEGR
jgi:hypothetical protein